jgi:hypothetical protein
MKELLTTALLCTILCAHSFSQIGKVGINTSSPAAMLHVKDSSVVFTSPYYENFPEYDAPPPVVGAGARLMWYPQRRSLRSGMVTGNQWDQYRILFFCIRVQSYSCRSNIHDFGQGTHRQRI